MRLKINSKETKFMIIAHKSNLFRGATLLYREVSHKRANGFKYLRTLDWTFN